MALVLSNAADAEAALVGAALLDEKVFVEAALQYCNFFNAEHQVAWKLIGKAIEAGIRPDEITIADLSCGKLSASKLSGLANKVGYVNTGHWTKIVRDNYIQRGVEAVGSNFARWADQGLSGADMIARMRIAIDKLEKADFSELNTLADVAAAEIKRIKNSSPEELAGLPTGLNIEKVVPGGIPRGKVTTLFGESGNFKTTVKNNLVIGMASAGFKVLDVSLEDADELTAHRFIAKCTSINYGRISGGDLSESEKERLLLPERAVEVAANVFMAGDIIPNIDEIIRIARLYNHRDQIDAVVIDYVQLLESRNYKHSQKEVLDDIMRKCQLAAKRDNMAYIIVSQVKQDVDQRTDHAPRITDMIGSSSMRTASKLAIGVFRPSLYNKTPAKNSGYEKLFSNHPEGAEVYKNMLELHFLKNVLGEPQVVIHCLVQPETGYIKPFNMNKW